MQNDRKNIGLRLNRADRLSAIIEECGDRCIWCQTEFRLTPPTTDHLIPKSKGGPGWIENEVASCRNCNKTRKSTLPHNWIKTCQGKGFSPDVDIVKQKLMDMQEAIRIRGGQRKIRPIIEGQLKRL